MVKVLQGGGVVNIGVEGTVDARVKILVGEFVVRGVPVKGIVPVEGVYPFDKELEMGLVGGVNVIGTTGDSITLAATVQVKNPTEYEAVIPYLNVQLLYQGYSLLLHAKEVISSEMPLRRMRRLQTARIKSPGRSHMVHKHP